MGIIKAATSAIGGALADQWLEVIEPNKLDNTVIATFGIKVRKNEKRGSNKKGTEDVISNGSVIHVPENTYMLVVDGGKIVDATDEAGYYQVDNTRSPSIFFQSSDSIHLEGYNNTGNGAIIRPGGIENTMNDSWERFKFGGTTPVKQMVVYINKMEIPNIRFGTKNPVSYTDRVLVPGRVVPCKLTSFGTYSIKVMDPMLFYAEVFRSVAKQNLEVDDLAEQYIDEFLMAYTTALASLSIENVLVSDIQMKQAELGRFMAQELDKDWLERRGFLIHSVGIASIHFDEKTNQLLDNYANDSILLDPNARAARMTKGVAAGFEAAGSNANGSMMGFAGMGMGMNATSGLGGVMAGAPQQQAQQPQNGWTCSCGVTSLEGAKFCSSCGSKKPDVAPTSQWFCSNCGEKMVNGMFCSKCGAKRP
jgi:membrane protease subunit (stomatin/prohibitin family)